MKNIKVFDTNSCPDCTKTVDRYIVVIGNSFYGMSINPRSPQGYNQYQGNTDRLDIKLCQSKYGETLFEDLPEEVQEAIMERISSMDNTT